MTNVVATPNIILYKNTTRKLPSHSILPKSPSKLKLVIPGNKEKENKKKLVNLNLFNYTSGCIVINKNCFQKAAYKH